MDCVTRVDKHPDPGETVHGKSLLYYPGGKGANQAVASARLGAETRIIGNVGNDSFGETLISFLKEQNVNTDSVGYSRCASGAALIAVDEAGENTIIVNASANMDVTCKQLKQSKLTSGDLILFQNEVNLEEMCKAFEYAKAKGSLVIYNPAPAIDVPGRLFELSDFVILNKTEANFYDKHLDPQKHVILKTLGAEGIEILRNDKITDIPGLKVKVIDTTGAGDCFTGAFAAALSRGYALENAAAFANKAASIAVQKHGAGTSMPFLREIE